MVPSVTVTWTKHSYIFLLPSGLLTHASQLWRGDLIQTLCKKCFLESKWLAQWRFTVNGCSFQLVLLCKGSLQTEIFQSPSTVFHGERKDNFSTPASCHTCSFMGQSPAFLLWAFGVNERHYKEPWLDEKVRQLGHLPNGQNLRGIKNRYKWNLMPYF